MNPGDWQCLPPPWEMELLCAGQSGGLKTLPWSGGLGNSWWRDSWWCARPALPCIDPHPERSAGLILYALLSRQLGTSSGDVHLQSYIYTFVFYVGFEVWIKYTPQHNLFCLSFILYPTIYNSSNLLFYVILAIM